MEYFKFIVRPKKILELFSSYCNNRLIDKLTLSTIIFIASSFSIQTIASPWYIGGGLGLGVIDNFCEDDLSRDCDDDGTAFQIFSGVKVNEYVAFELSTGGISGMKTPRSRVPERDGYTSVTLIGFNALFSIPLSEHVKLFGGPGIYYTRTSTEVYRRYYYGFYTSSNDEYYYSYYDYDDDGYSDYDDNHITDSSTEGSFIAGVEVKFSTKFSGRFQLQSVRSVDGGEAFDKDRNVNFFTANVVFNF
ncbi:MAG: outer membrane beta-barrel protein [Cellvibrionaceae bacterium]